MARKKRNRSQDIRDYLETDPSAGPAKIIAELKKKGISVSSALASRVKSRMQNPAGAVTRGRRGRPRIKGRQSRDELVAIDSLILARDFASKVGGVDEATRLLRMLSRIG